MLVSVQDGADRFGLFVDEGHAMVAKVAEGKSFVEVEGPLQVRRSNGFVNLNLSGVDAFQVFELAPVKG